MKAIASVDMDEVMRLTRAGRLLDATALLREGLGHRRPAARPEASERKDEQSLQFERLKAGDGVWQMPDAPSGGTREAAPPAAHAKRQWALDLGRQLKTRSRKPDLSVPPGASFETRTVENAAGSLDYKLYRPSSRPRGPAPLVVMLHGCTQNPDDFAAGTRMNELAELHGFFVAYPAQTRAANASRCWNWFKGSEQRRDQGEPSLIADATRQILSQHDVDPTRVFVAGLSAGGAAAAIMGCAYPDLFAGVGVHSGLACGAASDLSSALQAMRGRTGRRSRPSSNVPTIVFHGGADKTVSPSNAAEVVDQVVASSGPETIERESTATGRRFVRTVRHDSDGRAVSEQWMVEGAGHAWFGGDPTGSYTDPRGPDASREMLRFFGILRPTPASDASAGART